jgi:hypothetical protein
MINYKRAAGVKLAALCFVGQKLLVKRINFELEEKYKPAQ